MYALEDIIEFIKEQTARREVNADDDLFNDLGIAGDDHDEFMQAYSKKFNVDMSSYLWYFHTNEEGSTSSIRSNFFKPPNERVKHISITPEMLLEFAKKGKWVITYPEHTLPKPRYDILITYSIGFVIIAYLIYSCFKN